MNPLKWFTYAPIGRPQSNGIADSESCGDFSAHHSVQFQANCFLATNQLPLSTIPYLNQNYNQAGKFETSPIFNAIEDGTTQNGNNDRIVESSLTSVGLLPWIDMPLPMGENWQQYMAKQNVTPAMLVKAKNIFNYFTIACKPVIPTLITPEMLTVAPIQILIPVGSNWNTDELITPPVNVTSRHFVCLYALGDARYIFDSYAPYFKKLSLDYPILDAMQYSVFPALSTPTMPPSALQRLVNTLINLKNKGLFGSGKIVRFI